MSQTEAYKPEYTYLGIAAAGVYANAPNPWGDTPASVSIPDYRLTAYLGDLVEGGTVIDKRPCVDRDDFVKMVVSGPILQSNLPSGSIKVWDGLSRRIDPCTIEQAKQAKAFDELSLDLYAQVWADIGARVGVRKGNQIHWNDGSIQDIPPAELRWQCKG